MGKGHYQNQLRAALLMLGVGLFSGAVTVLSSWLLKHYELSKMSRFVVALLPVPAITVLFLVLIREVRSQDELVQRITLEALAFSFVGTGLTIVAWGFLQRAGFAPQEDWSGMWPIMVGLYLIGYFISCWRYR